MLNVACTVFMICTPIKAKNATHWSYGPPDYGRLSNRRRPTSSNWQTREPSHGRPQEDAEALERSALAARSEVGGCRRCESRAHIARKFGETPFGSVALLQAERAFGDR